MRAKSTSAGGNALHITNQWRTPLGMGYGLACCGQGLTLTVTPRTGPADSDEWRVDAQTARPPEPSFVITRWGPTRLEALRAVGREWMATEAAHGLSMFDWKAVAEVLATVRAV